MNLRLVAVGLGPALSVGMLIMLSCDAPVALPLTNLAAGLLGLLLLVTLGMPMTRGLAHRPFWVAAGILALEWCTLLSPGIDGVHRWLTVGNVRLHAAAIGEPVFLLCVGILWHRRLAWVVVVLVALALALHVAQPDAGQATALAAGIVTFVVLQRADRWKRAAMVAVALLGATWAWFRVDPLSPVDLVEHVISTAFGLHPALGMTSVLALALLPGAAFWVAAGANSMKHSLRWASGLALAVYFLVSIAVGFVGEFPTPILGFGAAPILGAIFGLGLASDSTGDYY